MRKTMPKIIILTFAFVTLLSIQFPVMANEQPWWPPSYKLKMHMLDKYLVTSGDLAHDKEVIQTEFTVIFPNGLNMGMWHSLGPDGSWNNDYGDELDWFAFLEWLLFGCEAQVGMWYFDMFRLLDMPEGDIINPFFQVSRRFEVDDKTGIAPHIRLDAYYPARGVWDRGSIWRLGAVLDHSLDSVGSHKGSGLRFAIKGELAYDDGGFGNDHGFFGDLNLGLSKELSRKSKSAVDYHSSSLAWEIIGFRLMVPLTVNDRRETETVFKSGFEFQWR